MCFHKYLSCKHADQCIGPVITPLLCGVCVEASLMPQMVKNLPTVQETQVRSLGQEDSPGEQHGNPLQYSCLENSMGRGASRAIGQGTARVGQN